MWVYKYKIRMCVFVLFDIRLNYLEYIKQELPHRVKYHLLLFYFNGLII